MLCPKCNFEFKGTDADTCPACRHQPGKSMYLDAPVKINDDSIIVDEMLAGDGDRHAALRDSQSADMPLDAVYRKIVDTKASAPGTTATTAQAHSAPPRYPQQERRKTAEKTYEELPPANTPAAATGAKSLAITVSIGAVLLTSFIGAGIYHLKYKTSNNAPAQIVSKTLILPPAAAPPPTYKAPPEEKPLSAVDIATDSSLQPEQHAMQPAEPALEKAPGPIPDTALQEIKPESTREQGAGMNTQQRAAAQVSPAKSVAAPPAKESIKTGSYMLLCGSFQSRQKAQTTVKKLKQQHYPAFIEEADLGAKGKWFRIKVGGFSSKDAAEKARGEIKRKLNIDALASKKK